MIMKVDNNYTKVLKDSKREDEQVKGKAKE